jgi:hypothetical protein
VNLQLSPNVTTIMSGNGNVRSYLHRLKIIESRESPLKKYSILLTLIKNHRQSRVSIKKDVQTIDNLIYQCENLNFKNRASHI